MQKGKKKKKKKKKKREKRGGDRDFIASFPLLLADHSSALGGRWQSRTERKRVISTKGNKKEKRRRKGGLVHGSKLFILSRKEKEGKVKGKKKKKGKGEILVLRVYSQ